MTDPVTRWLAEVERRALAITPGSDADLSDTEKQVLTTDVPALLRYVAALREVAEKARPASKWGHKKLTELLAVALAAADRVAAECAKEGT